MDFVVVRNACHWFSYTLTCFLLIHRLVLLRFLVYIIPHSPKAFVFTEIIFLSYFFAHIFYFFASTDSRVHQIPLIFIRHTFVSFEVLNEKWNSVLFLFYLWEKHENFIYVIIENVKIWKTSLTQSNSMGLRIRTK